MLDKDTVMRIARAYTDRVKDIFNPAAVYLFGSYVKGNAREWSDIDIAVIVKDFTDDWWDATVRLSKLRNDISYDIEPHLLDADDDRSGFLSEVLRTGIPLLD